MTSFLTVAAGVFASCAVLAAAAPSDRPTRPQTLPEEIAHFYADVNFVAAFSNILDRRRIRAEQRARALAALGYEPAPRPVNRPVEPLPARLQDVALRLARIERRTLRIDDIAVLGWGLRESAAAAELMRIVGQTRSGDTLRVRVEVWPMTAEYSVRLSADYDRHGRRDVGPVPPPEGLAGGARLEAHRWRSVDGQWMRMDGVVVRTQKAVN